jgi:hypothetical protein
MPLWYHLVGYLGDISKHAIESVVLAICFGILCDSSFLFFYVGEFLYNNAHFVCIE